MKHLLRGPACCAPPASSHPMSPPASSIPCALQVKCIMKQLLKGLAYVHNNGVLHR